MIVEDFMYTDLALYSDGEWKSGSGRKGEDVINPATGKVLAHLPHATSSDLDQALQAANKGSAVWRATSAYDRAKVLRKAAGLVRERADNIARIMTQEQGKVLAESRVEVLVTADIIDWFAEEGRRAYGRLVPGRVKGTRQMVVQEPVGVLAAKGMKRATMELGGHSPVVVFGDADPEKTADTIAAFKYRNAGQVCISPTRFYVQEPVYDRFLKRFTDYANAIKLGDGLESGVTMGPLANPRRLDAMEAIVNDSRSRGATIVTGGKRRGNQGYFFEPTVVTHIPDDSRLMTEEPFGPIAPVVTFKTFDEVVERANSLKFGLAAYAFTSSTQTANALGDALEAGMVGINSVAISTPETPFGGVKDSGYGHEGGIEGLEAYMVRKFISQA